MLGETNFESTIAVLFGGRSSEHEISLRSAVYVLKNLPAKYRIIPVAITREGEYRSLEGTFCSQDFTNVTPEDLAVVVEGRVPRVFSRSQCVPSMLLPVRREILRQLPDLSLRLLNLEAGVFFPVLHGPNGEDGRLQGVFELAEVPYVGCDLRASALGIDKDVAKRLARDAGVPIAKYEAVESEEWQSAKQKVIERVETQIGYPCFVKPNALGSAVGVNRAKNKDELSRYLSEALSFDDKALVEEPMTGTEVEVAFLGTGVSPRVTAAGEIATQDFYSYDVKYLTDEGSAQFIPARLDAPRMEEIQNLARKIARTLGLYGLCRIDFWNCKKTNRFVFNEVNTLPGLTSISMFPKLWEHEGVSGAQWTENLIEGAWARFEKTSRHQHGVKAQ